MENLYIKFTNQSQDKTHGYIVMYNGKHQCFFFLLNFLFWSNYYLQKSYKGNTGSFLDPPSNFRNVNVFINLLLEPQIKEESRLTNFGESHMVNSRVLQWRAGFGWRRPGSGPRSLKMWCAIVDSLSRLFGPWLIVHIWMLHWVIGCQGVTYGFLRFLGGVSLRGQNVGKSA